MEPIEGQHTKVSQMKAQIVAGISNKGFALQSVIAFDEEVISEWKEHFAIRDRKPEVWEFNLENLMKTIKNGASAVTVFYNLDEVGRMILNNYPEVQDFPEDLKELAVRCHKLTCYSMIEDIMVYQKQVDHQ